MKIAFLFIEQNPNYDLAFKVFSKFKTEEIRGLDTYIRCGMWGLDSRLLNDDKGMLSEIDKLRILASNIQFSSDGNLSRLSRLTAFDSLVSDQIYTVQFDSIRRPLALALHDRLKKLKYYLGFIEVLPSYPTLTDKRRP